MKKCKKVALFLFVVCTVIYIYISFILFYPFDNLTFLSLETKKAIGGFSCLVGFLSAVFRFAFPDLPSKNPTK